ncbi:MAG: efflux transporter outer membrane subunit [Acidobacteriota bacterium]|nr:efflux transporter outer membrane subunit [Acidobacteriota bacterium]MDH3786239.1 efflux transporter outer membrane subunit [Acidobacteriota bacterium]
MRAAVFLLAALLGVGCARAPVVTMPVSSTPPDRFTATLEQTPASETFEADAWWTQFGDAQLNHWVERALEQNRDLEAAAARVDRAAAEARIRGADLRPSVSFDPSFSRQRQNFIGLPIPGSSGNVLSTTTSRYGVGLNSQWEVDLWGRLRAASRGAMADFQATRADYRGARLSLVAQTVRAWFSLLEADDQLALARDSETSFRDSAEQVRSRFESGLRPAIELRLALSSLHGAEALVERWRQQRDAAMRQLEILVGDYPAGRLAGPEKMGPLPDLPPSIPVGLPATLIARRPDLSAAERRIQGAEQRTLAARRSLYPRLTLTAGAGTVSDDLGDLLDGDFRVWNIAAGIFQPIFQGGRLRADVERNQQIQREQVAAFQAAALRAYGEVESALVAEEALARRLGHLNQASEQLLAAVRLAEDRYRNGIGDYLTVLESQTRALQALTSSIGARRQLLDNRISLHLALGGGFDRASDRIDPTETSR